MDVLMPQLGETVAEGKITKWFKAAGDAVKPGDNLFEIETDKTSMEVPATFGGTLSDIRFQVGEVAKVGAVVAVITGEGETAAPKGATPAAAPAPVTAAPAPAAVAPKRPAAPVTPSRSAETAVTRRVIPFAERDPYHVVMTPDRNYGPAVVGGVSVTPLARRLASERGIDLSRLSGSGPHGRIVAKDVETAVPTAARGTALATGASAAQVKALYEGVAYEEIPLDGMRTTIARRLVESKQTVPHFYLTADIDVARLVAMREEANAGNEDAARKLSLNDFIIKAWAGALMRVPEANAVWAEDRVLRFAQADIGVAVALDGGLITPVIRNADSKAVSAISAEMKELAARARDRKLAPADYQGGSSAISNLGMYGVREFSAIINPPHATILAVGASRRVPVEAADGSVRFTTQMTVTVSCDHRAVDGALGAKLLAAFKAILEKPIAAIV
ncbi:MAG TPA: dihydrolipoamide acetyltransferase family protein [Pseudolabrys sp.]|nr:dihydrolipoamide acetyltransferase family protein [Pseudolabrys sp.]